MLRSACSKCRGLLHGMSCGVSGRFLLMIFNQMALHEMRRTDPYGI